MVAELSQFVGREGTLRMENLFIHVRVVDARKSYGKIQLQIQPVDTCGVGTQWVDAGRVIMND